MRRLFSGIEAAIFVMMGNINEHEATIARLEDEKRKLLPHLDAIIKQFEREIPEPASVWMRAEVQRRIEDKVEHVAEMGLSGVRGIKEELARIISDLPEVAAESIRDESSWPHRKKETSSGGSQEAFLDRVFRDLISRLGPLLERHQLMKLDRQYAAWERVGGGKWRYRINPGLEPVLPEISSRYSDGLSRLRQIEFELESAKTKLAQARATDLWNRA